MNVQISGILAIQAAVAPSWILVAQSDVPALSVYDEWMLGFSPLCIYQTHIAAAPGGKMTRPIRVYLYGEGVLGKSIVIASVDKQRREAYNVETTDTSSSGDLLICQNLSGSLVGYEHDYTFYLSGLGLVPRRCVIEFEGVQ